VTVNQIILRLKQGGKLTRLSDEREAVIHHIEIDRLNTFIYTESDKGRVGPMMVNEFLKKYSFK
jgi:hypothetical protein